MLKRLTALLLLLMMGTALAEEQLADGTVQVGFVNDEQVYTAVCSGELTLYYDAEDDTYRTVDGLTWAVGAQTFGTYEPLLMARTREELLALNRLYASLQDASEFWKIQASGNGTLPVYTAPDTASYRAAKGKASVALKGGVKLLMTYDGWSMVAYEVNSSKYRIGWVETVDLGAAPVSLTDIPVTLKSEAFLTDDPIAGWSHLAEGDALTDVHLLAQYGTYWGYVSARTADDTAVQGFVSLRDLLLDLTADAATASSLCGTWGFTGGGELMGTAFILHENGTLQFASLPEEAAESVNDLTAGIPEEGVLSEEWTWQVIGGTNGYAHDVLMGNDDGLYTRYHIDLDEDGTFGVYQGEAGGFYVRIP